MTPSQARLRTGVLEVLRANGAQSRAESWRAVFDVSRSTISAVIAALIAERLVTEKDGEGPAARAAGGPARASKPAAPEG